MIFAYTFSLLIVMSSMCDFIYTTISLTLLAYHLEVFFFAYFSFLVPGNIVLYSVRVAILTLCEKTEVNFSLTLKILYKFYEKVS